MSRREMDLDNQVFEKLCFDHMEAHRQFREDVVRALISG